MTDTTDIAEEPGARIMGYWITTILVAFVLSSAGVVNLMRLPVVVKEMAHLDYPSYVCVVLGTWKLLGTVAILMPGTPRLKEWAYAGIVFDFTGAGISHIAVGDNPSTLIAPIILTALTLISWALRPPTRRLPDAPVSNP